MDYLLNHDNINVNIPYTLNPHANYFCPTKKYNNIHFGNNFPKNLNFIYTNLQGMLEACHFDEFKNEVCKSKNIHIYAICETWLRQGVHSNKTMEIDGFKLFRSDRLAKSNDNNKGGGVILYVKKGIGSKIIIRSSDNNHDIKNSEFIFIEITSKFFKMCVCVLYRTNKCNVTDTLKLFNLIIKTTSNYNNVLIMGDFNLNIINGIGSLKILNDYFKVINHQCPTHKWPSAEPSLIDIALTKNINRIQNFSHFNLIPSTHHDLLCISYKAKNIKHNKPTSFNYRDYGKINPEKLILDASSIDWTNFNQASNINTKVHILTENYHDLFNSNVPLVNVKLNYSTKSWFTPELNKFFD